MKALTLHQMRACLTALEHDAEGTASTPEALAAARKLREGIAHKQDLYRRKALTRKESNHNGKDNQP